MFNIIDAAGRKKGSLFAAIFQRDPPSGSEVIPEKLMGGASTSPVQGGGASTPPPARARVNDVKITICLSKTPKIVFSPYLKIRSVSFQNNTRDVKKSMQSPNQSLPLFNNNVQ